MPHEHTSSGPGRKGGRNPYEAHRVATPLELLFDLTFATCFSLAASRSAAALSEGHFAAVALGFPFASFAICWAWSNFSWFSSAYDTDDRVFRLLAMAQMLGVLVLATGLPHMLDSVSAGGPLDNSVMVLGYVIMRVALVAQWLRAARHDPGRRRTCLAYAALISVAQVGWILQVVLGLTGAPAIALGMALGVVELSGPFFIERGESATPWHAHHITERHTLFAIIAFGEGIVGTVAALSASVLAAGWTLKTALVGIAGGGLTFGMWWMYSLLPNGHVLQRHRDRAIGWGLAQLVIVTCIVATGAGLHFAAHFIEGESQASSSAVALCVAAPTAAFVAATSGLNSFLTRKFDSVQLWLLLATGAVTALAVLSAAAGAGMVVPLLLVALTPWVTVVVREVARTVEPSREAS